VSVPAPAAGARPSSAEASRTLLDICDRGTLATTTEDAWPMGTHAAYLLDAQGQPLLRLRADALHTAHLLRDPRCSLYVQARPRAEPLWLARRRRYLRRVRAAPRRARSRSRSPAASCRAPRCWAACSS
jgi:putative heme iron utilization protein